MGIVGWLLILVFWWVILVCCFFSFFCFCNDDVVVVVNVELVLLVELVCECVLLDCLGEGLIIWICGWGCLLIMIGWCFVELCICGEVLMCGIVWLKLGEDGVECGKLKVCGGVCGVGGLLIIIICLVLWSVLLCCDVWYEWGFILRYWLLEM